MMTIPHYPQGEAWESHRVTRWLYQLVEAFNTVQRTGTTAERLYPAPYVGFQFFDTTLGKPIWAKTLTQYALADGTNV
jgi:hypothetical protein